MRKYALSTAVIANLEAGSHSKRDFFWPLVNPETDVMLLATGYFNVDFRTPILIYLTISQIKKFFVNSISDQFLTELIRLPVTFGMGFRYLYKP